MIHKYSRYILTLVALFAMTAGAWAQDWTNIVVNSDMEGTDVSCFYVKENANGAGNMYIARITEGIGVENSRAIKVLSDGKEVQTWDTQFFIRLPYELPKGTPYRLSFDYKADRNASGDFQCANEPGEYIIWYIGENDESDFSFTDSWQNFNKEFTVPGDCDGSKSPQGDWLMNFQTIYFSLAMDAPNGTPAEFIIDNVKVEIPTSVLNTLTPKPVTAPSLMLTYVTKDATNQWSFTMPGYDMELTPIYAPAAQWATESNVELLPTAAEGIIAGTDAPLIVEGTVATAGTTENPQGLVMYAVTTTNTTAPALSAFSSDVPTAADIADDGATVYVWYYIAGADTPDGETATAENTFNDSEISATPLKVIVLSNKFDITFNAANANTIEAGKATVTVGGAAATVTEGKLKGVKMGSKVKMIAKNGYKFRKVEAKKGAAAGPLTIYSWESPSGTPTETGGTIAYVNGDTSNGDRVNYNHTATGIYTICLNGKKTNITDGTASENSGRMDVTLDEALAAGDVITITAYIYKSDTGASSDAYVIFNGANGFDKDNMSNVIAESEAFDLNNNLYYSGAAKTITVKVPAEAAGCKSFSMTRGITKTNLFITKLEVLRGAAAE